ncbi:MAG: CsoS2 family carboxysome shell protein [Salibaculum sp.]|uniref:CsoS2 family carboxysome shell protein n=1 Tax=Salibaculum sp. TaxID=2855480 RepID=UPI0028700D00|nr:CsoS2 family carboxysome shell protein [Salibaculum sp.]MDR9428244.1 CsoS2 family carboxysome shell protein [Salibaculum sp.]
MSGREASQLRRRLLSQGKAALPPASERVRSGFRAAELPEGAAMAPEAQADASQNAKTDVPAAFADAAGPASSAPPVQPVSMPAGGRAASRARRKALSQGKTALPPATERVRSGFRAAALPEEATATPGDRPAAGPTSDAPAAQTGREAAKQRRAMLAKHGRAGLSATGDATPARKGALSYPDKVPAVTTSVTQASVTGLSYATGRAVTGAEAGRDMPLTGTQYVAGAEGGYRPGSGKVGHVTSPGGQVVSGTMVRSGVRITGDEDSASAAVTGNADQSIEDVAPRGETHASTGAQFARQSQPHGASVFGTNLGRSARTVGSRIRDTQRAVEQTIGGHAVSGTAVGRSRRVSGDEDGANRALTGSQYLGPAGHQAADQDARGTEGADRTDPVSGGKVNASRTWGGQTITGPEMEHEARVTGSEHGTCQTLTGTPYYGASGAKAWCDPDQVESEAAMREKRTPRAITGDVPLNDPMVSGTQRGADHAITGSSYFVAEERGTDTTGDPVAQSIGSFSVTSPQRETHLQARSDQAHGAGSAVTGTFSRGEGKVTGSSEFHAPGRGRQDGRRVAHDGVTGEGSTRGTAITGSAWQADGRVTGTEDDISSGRNPSERSGSAQAFAGARHFKAKALNHDPVSPVTGATGGTPEYCATVTLSGGAAG